MTARGLTIIGASAGSGKTHRLTQEVIAAVAEIPLESLVAVTYTRKAHAELAARLRQTLVAAGAFADAAKLPLAAIGTVHAACLRLIEEFAFEAGVSPRVEPVGGDPARLLRESLEPALAPDFRRRMDELAYRLQIEKDDRIGRYDWLRPVGQVMELARSNRIAPDRLPDMARRSADGLLALLPPAAGDAAGLDAALREELDRAIAAAEPGTKIGAEALGKLRAIRANHRGLTWASWLTLSKLDGGVLLREALAPVHQAAAAYERHPRFHAELRELTAGIFEAARVGLAAYDHWKQRRGLVDYTDMIDRALTLLDHPEVATELADRLRLVVVDELQDTSPLQLALFVRLHALARRSVWVGDPKQCIFEYAGADPLLMEAVTTWVAGSGGATDQLPRNYRSRPELVAFTSDLFARALARHGVPPEQVRVAPVRAAAVPELEPLGLWWLTSGKLEQDAHAVATGVARLLAEAPAVIDRQTAQPRPLRPGDVAVLVATNREARDLATALYRHGVHAAVARPDLLATPEGTLVEAALHLLLDPLDALSSALLDALSGWGGDPDRWLDARVADPATAGTSAWQLALETVRPRLDALSPTEAVDCVILALDVETACARWPDPTQRLANLDALRALAVAYEERCRRRAEAATLTGLLRYFDEAREIVLVRDEELATDDQHVRQGEDVVTISTYHRAKGLEWPVVVLASLDKDKRRSAFDVSPESDREAFDATDPLGGRWIRYWPWPFVNQNAPLEERAAESSEGRRIALREDRERLRLLYVGFTRARDHLVLAVRRSKHPPEWLAELRDADGNPLLPLPDLAEGTHVLAGTHARIWTVAPTPPVAHDPPPAYRFARAAPVERPPYWIAPSRAAVEWPDLPRATVAEVVSLESQLPFARQVGLAWDVAGIALHAFLACDVEDLPADERLLRASRLIARGGLTGVARPEDLLASSDALRRFVTARWPGARWRRELPITAMTGGQRIEGSIDLLLETPAGDVVVDHKTFPAPGESAVRAKAAELAPQLSAYAAALRLLGRTVAGTWFHFPLGGVMVRTT